MKGNMSAPTRSIGITKPLSNLQLKYIPPGQKMWHWPNDANCRSCRTIHDHRLNPNAREFIHDHRLNPNAMEFIPGRRAGIENTAPGWSGAVRPASPRAKAALSCSSPYKVCNRPGPAQRPAPCLPGGPTREAGPSPAGVSADTCSARSDADQSTGHGAGVASGVWHRDGKPATFAAMAGSRCTGPADSPPREWGRRTVDSRSQRGAEEVYQKQDAVAVQNGTERPTPPSAQCDSSIFSLASAAEAELCHKINSVRVSPDSEVPCSLTSLDSVHNASDISKRTHSPSQCSDSTKPRRANSRDSRANSPASCAQSATSPTATVILRQPSSSTSDLDAPAECDAPAAASAAGRWWSLSSSSVSINTESSEDSSDESNDDDSMFGDEECDASSVTFVPGSSIDSADDFILFVSEDECCPTEPGRSPTVSSGVPQTPVFGPCPDQVDSGLSAETDLSVSDVEDSSEDELSEDECDSCHSAPAGTCTTHQRIAKANRELHHWCGTPPLQPRTCKVRFLSGDRLATVHAAPDYDRGIASYLLDQQRQRDRLCRWRQDVDRQVAPVLAAVLTPEHRERVLSERPELLRS